MSKILNQEHKLREAVQLPHDMSLLLLPCVMLTVLDSVRTHMGVSQYNQNDIGKMSLQQIYVRNEFQVLNFSRFSHRASLHWAEKVSWTGPLLSH